MFEPLPLGRSEGTRSDGATQPLLRVAVRPSATLGLAAPSWVMVEKVTIVRRDRAREILGRLSTPEMEALGQSLAVLPGFG